MPVYKTEYFSGDVYEAEIYFSPRVAGKNIPRGKNQNLSSEQQLERNLRNAQKKLSRLINTNFGFGDIFITLTYAEEPEETGAQKMMKKYIRRIRNLRRKNGVPELKYIAVTESGDKRIHHHIIMSRLDYEAAIGLWDHGRVIISRMDQEVDYTGLAHYITKDTRKQSGKRWSQSKNLDKPKVVRKEVKRPKAKLRIPKGYKEIVREHYASEQLGEMQYLKAVKLGGMDYALGIPEDNKKYGGGRFERTRDRDQLYSHRL